VLDRLIDQKSAVEEFLGQQLSAHRLPIYSSIDIRDAGFKVAPIDTNLFPAGFNNLTPSFRAQAIRAAQQTLLKYYPNIHSICLIPENHTRNKFYFDNLRELQGILQAAGYRVVLGSIHPEFNIQTAEFIAKEYQLEIKPLEICAHQVCVAGEPVDLVILNNDLTGENAELLREVTTPIAPKVEYGWNQRQKSTHFEKYTLVAETFANHFNIDPWLITPTSTWQSQVNFQSGEHLDEVAHKVNQMLENLKQKYQQYQIDSPPAVFIKNNRGTYGMGIMVVSSAQEVLELNRKTKNKMSVGKNKTAITEVLIQEGIPTILKDHDCSAEPVMYLFDQFIAGGFLRVNCSASSNTNLNSPGMSFTQFRYEPYEDQTPRNYLYSVISRLAVWACALEN
jgi:glutamate--cysteine ligase